MAIPFDYFHKCVLSVDEPWGPEQKWDVFISAFNSSERVRTVFSKATAPKKYWLIFPEYNYAPVDYPADGQCFSGSEREESEYLHSFFSGIDFSPNEVDICIDITGFMRPHLLHLVRYLQFHRVRSFDVIYSEPIRYRKKDDTKFSQGPVTHVRPVAGFEGQHSSDNSNDLLLVGVGYDHELIKQVAEYKDYANVVTLWGFPSLRADMYQESVLRASKAVEAVFSANWQQNRHFAIANDPFAIATALREIVELNQRKKKITNLYLSPLATKPQALGFALYYAYDWIDKEASIIFPFADSYDQETSTGLSKIWKYKIELPLT
jgi:hypothetical protein